MMYSDATPLTPGAETNYRTHYKLGFARRLGKENVAGWSGIDTSNEVATGELADGSKFNM